jgi:hypothetical protein
VERLRHIVGWFDKFVTEKPSIQYDLESGAGSGSFTRP